MSTVLEKQKIVDTEIFPIHFIDLKAQKALLQTRIEQALHNVLSHGMFVGGPEVSALEKALAEFCGAKHALTCANGTDALTLVLLAKGVKAGDAVFVPSYTFAASAEVVASIGATPVFVDVNLDNFNLNMHSLSEALTTAKQHGLTPKAIIAVDLFGLPADYANINLFAEQHGLWVLADGAQSFGGGINKEKVGTFGLATTTSFFPAKPLGCYGDGGCIFTEDDELAEVIASLKSHGQQQYDRENFIRIGMNSRLDSFQAAILLEKLRVFPAELQHRQFVAQTYAELLDKRIKVPVLNSGLTSSWAQFTIILPEEVNREHVVELLKHANIPTAIYYKKPVHRQPAYEQYSKNSPQLPNTEYLSKHVLSLPMDGYLSVEKINYIANNLNKAIQ